MLRPLWLIAIVACGSPAPVRDTANQPRLAGDKPPPGDPAMPAEMTMLIDQQCVPAGTYTVTIDLLSAEVETRSNTPRARCVELAGQLPEKQSLSIDYDSGAPHVAWNGPMQVSVVDACAFMVVGNAGRATILFRNGKGRGPATLELDEGCVARAVRLEVSR